LPRGIINIIICIFLSVNVWGQATIKGRVIQADSDAPLAGASVYLNNTSIGTTTNEAGDFILLKAISGELIISSIGYERVIYRLDPDSLMNNPLLFKLKRKQSMLRDILVLSDASRKRYLHLFLENFLGLTEEADRSSILNLNSLEFSGTNDKNSFIAYSDTPLTIINRKLGYRIRFDLVEFYLNEKSGQTFFYGFTRYEELGDKNRWLVNRRKAYYGSSLHFLRSLIHNNLEQENYAIFLLSEDSVKTTPAHLASQKLNIAVPIRAGNIIKSDSSISKRYFAHWPGTLMVKYLKNPANKYYLSKRIFIPGNIRTGTVSYLALNAGPVGIGDDGLLEDPMKVFFSGYWAYEKAANLLPYNYFP
jgi:hypothetical protein